VPEPFSLFLAAVGKAAGDRAAREASDVLRGLLGLQSAQEELLMRMDVKLDALLERPYKTGRRHLNNALAHWREPDERRDLLNDARRSFTEAQDHPLPVARSFASMHLAAVWVALDRPHDVRASLRDAHVDALHAVVVEHKRKEKGDLARPGGAAFPAAKAVALIPLANHIAMARREWGEPHRAAPIFVGFATPVTPPSDLRPVEQARWLILNTGGWGLPVGGVDYSTTPLERRQAESDEVVEWVRWIERDEGTGTHYWRYIERWLQREATPG
jgi:hypothetical protein